jgi:hypothetical protein
MPADRKRIYEERLIAAQSELARLASPVSRTVWPGAVSAP